MTWQFSHHVNFNDFLILFTQILKKNFMSEKYGMHLSVLKETKSDGWNLFNKVAEENFQFMHTL